jgi:hypothetical protein
LIMGWKNKQIMPKFDSTQQDHTQSQK